MLPASPHSMSARLCHARSLCGPLTIALFCLGAPQGAAMAQDGADTMTPQQQTAEQREVAFEADGVSYDSQGDIVTASGNVVMESDGQTLLADSVSWDRKTGQIVASGNIRLTDADGNHLYADNIELTDALKAGAMQNLLLVLTEGGRMAARSGDRAEDGSITLTDTVYSGCAVVKPDGCTAKKPSWRVIANRVIYDPAAKKIHFKGARLELFGAPLIPLPGLSVNSDGRANSGFLIPYFGLSHSNGIEIGESYYMRLSDNRDLTLGGYVYSKSGPMARGRYRALTEDGAYQVEGYLTHSSRIPVDETATKGDKRLRGYFGANGRFQIDPNWSITASARIASDRTFLRRYDISRDDRLRSMVKAERIDDNSYLSITGWATQTLRVGEDQSLVPVALPIIDYRRKLASPVLGGRVNLQVNSLAITRTSGQDTQRAFASARWDMRRITALGQEVTLTGLVRGDVYHSTDNALTDTVIYRGNPGWEARAIGVAALDVKWPFVGEIMGGTQVLTPRFQVVATPSVRNLAVPNEDARAIDLEDSNLFALNRFPGYDRVEDGVRFTYGFDWQLDRPGWRIKTTVGQSYRLTRHQQILPDGTGLNARFSDIVGRTEIRFRDFVSFTHRFRADKDSLSLRRNEFDATVGSRKTYAEISYLRLNRNIAAEFEDLRDREELRASGRLGIGTYWSLFGSAVINLTDRKEDPDLAFVSDGFDPLRTRLGIAYQDDCLEMGFTWRRDYQSTGDARRGNSFQVYFSLKNLGV
ncbi:MAG: LPS-assembly protein LptD [Novosphingobium sp.]|nr:LPS-assembly protein LptD [Novosphingobium sp.]